MHVLVLNMEPSGSGGLDAIEFLRLPSLRGSGRVVLIGPGAVASLSRIEVPDGVIVSALDLDESVSAPSSDRRFPSGAGSEQGGAFMRSLRLFHHLEALCRGEEVRQIEIPTLGALAFCLLQDRRLEGAFRGAKVLLRLDGLTLMERARKGLSADWRTLLCADMERMAILECDGVLLESRAQSESIRKFLRIEANRWTALSADQLPQVIERPPQLAQSPEYIVCVSDELSSIRQFLRAAVGLMRSDPSWDGGVGVLRSNAAGDHVLCAIPDALRHRFRIVDSVPERRDAKPVIVVFADRWSASARTVRQMQRDGLICVVNESNPVFEPDFGWVDRETVLRYADSAASLHAVLEIAMHWAPVKEVAQCGDVEILFGIQHQPAEMSLKAGDDVARVSVIVPYFNLGRWLPETLASVRAAEYPNLEIIIVDDASTDPFSVSVLDRLCALADPGVIIHRLAFNQGLSAARNAGLSICSGEFVLTLDADDIISPEFIATAVAALACSPTYDFVVPRAAYFDGDVPLAGFTAVAMSGGIPLVGEAWSSGVFANRFSTATCMGRKAVMVDLRYDERLRAYEDWDFFRRAVQQGSRFLITNDVTFLYRQRSDSMIHSPEMRRKHAQLVAEMGAASSLHGEVLPVSLQTMQVMAAPPGVEGGETGLLLSDVMSSLEEAERLKNSRIMGVMNRLSWLTRPFQRR